MVDIIVKRIPTEILLQIFHICKDCQDSAQYLFNLSLVCRLWREVVQGCPTLWSDIWLDVSSDMPKLERQVKYQLERAGDTLLSLAIEFPSHSARRWTEQECAARSVQLAEVVRGSMPRWKLFRMRAYLRETRLFFDNCVGHTPHLSHITIALSDIKFEAGVSRLSIPFQRPVGADSGPPIQASFMSCLPIYPSLGASITSLEVDVTSIHPHTSDLIAMLLSCPNLVRYHLRGGFGQTIGIISDPVQVPLPHLLDLRVSGLRDSVYILGALRFEGLRSLSIDVFYFPPVLQDILESIFRSCTLLTAVNINGSMFDRLDAPLLSGFTWQPVVLPSVKQFTFSRANAALLQLFRQLSLPCAQTLEIHRAPCDVAYHLMSSSAQLASASFFELVDAPLHHAPITTLPNPDTIVIVGSLELLSYIDAPNLCALSLTNTKGYHNIASNIRSLIERSTPPLRKLRLIGVHQLTDEDLIWCLRRLPFVEELEIGSSLLSDITLRALAAPSPPKQGADVGVLLPRLRSANFWDNYPTPHGLAALAASRSAVAWTYD
ncbi:hypothetical protein BOTBODRAFT_223952 [Botryobasidium botryosum FD-172 SS1]|uniref:F-box domain-containing protein n=1 Tax=Botryobasidium botryosum (strain FD-172 SS1) TaxID=930990 RepID=A0A067MNB2_BOTB1|nr:hypothetical protein BOTBODRAFT_223952 [Botryobasidium botryosum FD-172 SS1]